MIIETIKEEKLLKILQNLDNVFFTRYSAFYISTKKNTFLFNKEVLYTIDEIIKKRRLITEKFYGNHFSYIFSNKKDELCAEAKAISVFTLKLYNYKELYNFFKKQKISGNIIFILVTKKHLQI